MRETTISRRKSLFTRRCGRCCVRRRRGTWRIARSMSVRIPTSLRSPLITAAPIARRWSVPTACLPPRSDASCRNWRKHVLSFAIMAISIGRTYGPATTHAQPWCFFEGHQCGLSADGRANLHRSSDPLFDEFCLLKGSQARRITLKTIDRATRPWKPSPNAYGVQSIVLSATATNYRKCRRSISFHAPLACLDAYKVFLQRAGLT
ncbi:hypothetical protein V1281_004494 [Nitrobacteraceae bacterium AZCC 2161]